MERHIHPLLSLHILYTHRHTPSHNQLMAKTVRLCVHTGPSLDRNPIKQLWFILIQSFFLQHKWGERGATEAGFLTAGVGHRPTSSRSVISMHRAAMGTLKRNRESGETDTDIILQPCISHVLVDECTHLLVESVLVQSVWVFTDPL